MYFEGGLKCFVNSPEQFMNLQKNCFCTQKGCLLLTYHVKLVVATTYVVVAKFKGFYQAFLHVVKPSPRICLHKIKYNKHINKSIFTARTVLAFYLC